MLRKKILTSFFILFFSALALNGIAGTLYWVGDGGNWNDAKHWSHTSGGNGGAGIPGSTDDVIFDINSFSTTYEEVDIKGIATCHNLQWMPDVNYSTLAGNNLTSLTIYGSANADGVVNFKFQGSIHFKSSQLGNTVNLGVGKLGDVYFEGSGSWKLSKIIYASTLYLNSGELDANGFEVACSTLNIMGYSKKTLDITNSELFIENQFTQQYTSGFKFNSANGKMYYRHYPIASLSATTHSTHRAMSVDSSHYGQRNLLCNTNDSLGNAPAPCNGEAWISQIFATDGGPFSYKWSNGQTTDTATGLCALTYFYQIYDSNDFSQTSPTFVTITQPFQLTIAFQLRQPKCFGLCDGWIYYCIAGETANYTYTWSNGPAGSTPGCPKHLYDSALCPGSYWINIKDANGCHTTPPSGIKLKPASAVKVTTTFTNPTCSGSCNGTATATPSGGPPTTNWKYKWNPGGQTTKTAVGLCVPPTTYNITATDDSGCSGTGTAILVSPTPVAVSISAQTNENCWGDCNGNATASASGGTPSYTYLWYTAPKQTTDPATSLCAGTYKVVASDANGCKDSVNVTITQPNPLTVSISTTNNPLKCFNDCNATASASVLGGTAPYSYDWNNGGTSASVGTTASITSLCIGKYVVTVTDAHGCTTKDSVTITQPTAINVKTNSITDPLCNGSCTGAISTTSSGGTPGYTYSWTPSGGAGPNANSLCAGIYTLNVTDKNGCIVSITDTIKQPAAINVSLILDHVSCSGSCDGKAFATVSGGIIPYTYKWNKNATGTVDSITGLCAGNDSLKVKDANACATTVYFTITQPAPLSDIISSNNASCTACNGNATVKALGGTPPYTYSWTTAPVQTTAMANNLCAGSYTVTIKDADSCSITQKVVIVPTVTITLTSSATGLTCNGACDGKATANASGGTTPYTYSWTTVPVQTTATASGLCAGTYTVTVHDFAGCTNTDSVTFVNPPPLTAVTSNTNVSCNGSCVGTATVTASGGTPPYTYLWSTGATTSTVAGLCPGNTTIQIFDKNLCTVSYIVTVTQAPPLAANPTVTPPACGASNGTIMLAPTGGVTPYTYSWSTGATTQNLIGIVAAGTPTVTITDFLGCTQSFAIPVSNSSGPKLGSTPKNTTCWNSCNGYDTVFVTVLTTSPYTYKWNTGATTSAISGLCPGPYNCAVTDGAGCITVQADTIKSPKKLKPNATVVNVTCNGANNGSICFNPSGGTAPYFYAWSGGQTTSCLNSLPPGAYNVIISDNNGCDSAFSINITQPAVLTVAMSSTNVLCNGDCNGTGDGVPSGGTLPYTYLWTTGAVIPPVANLCPGPYKLTVTDANGCTAKGNINITQPAVLSGVMAHTNVSCNLGNNGTASIKVSGGTIAYSYSWSPSGATTSAINSLPAGTYVVTVTDKNGCSITDSVSVTQPAPLTVSLAGTNATCFGDCDGSATPTISGGTPVYSYNWSSGTTTSIATSLCGSTTYTLDVTDSKGCKASNNVTISQPSAIVPGVSSTNTKCPSSCDGSASSSPSGGTTPYTYSWQTGATTSSINNLCAGSYSVTITDANLCTATATVTITNPLPITTSPATAASSCGACNGTISLPTSGGTGTYTYVWSTGATTSSISSVCAGVYTYTVTDANLCTASFTVILNNSSGPTATITSNNDSCNGECDGVININPTGGTTPYTYVWSPTGQTTQNVSNLCANHYTFAITDAAGCIYSDTSSITQPTILTNSGVVVAATCIGVCNGSVTLTTSGGTPPYKYNWSGGQTTSAITNVCPGADTVTITDAHLCSLQQIFTVGQSVIITPTVTWTNLLCHDSCVGTAQGSGVGGTLPYTYKWSNGTTTSNIAALCAGNYGLTITDKNGCQALDTAKLIQPTAILVTFSNTPISCNGDCNGAMTAVVSGGTPGYNYLWSTSGTAAFISSLCSGTYSVKVTDKNGCPFDTSATLIDPPVLSVTNFIVNATCNTTADGSVTATATGGVTSYHYSWSNGETTSVDNNLLPGTYILTLTDSTNCVLMDTVTVAADTTVIAEAGNDTAVCAGNSVTLNGNASINASTYEWFALPTWTPVGATSVVSLIPAATTQYVLVATDGLCSSDDTMMVIVNPLPAASAGGSQTIFIGMTATLGGSPTGPAGSKYSWTPNASLNDSIIANPIASPTVTTKYTVTVTTPSGCSSTDTVTIFVAPEFVPPDGFTPNGDGINDTWVLPVGQFPDMSVEIYNRWGERLYHSIGYKIPWDGTYMHEALPVGTYYYVINLNDPRFPKAYTGPVTIMR